MLTFKYSFDRHAETFAINGSTSASYRGVPSEYEARIALARKIDQIIKEETEALNRLKEMRNAVFQGDLPPEIPPKA
jgi:hypothetical protein